MNRLTIGIGVAVVLILGFLVFKPSENKQNSSKTQTVSTLRDAHGLAVGRKDSSKVYVATHTGLLFMNSDGELQQIGNARDDYMGFSAHPTDPNTFYTSGHPGRGGNLGFHKSTDGGQTWQKIANGVNGPVDFHAMTVSQADPSIIYGHHGGQLQRSNDEGKNWEIVNSDLGNVITLATNTKDRDTIYAGTTDGLYISRNQGQDWSKVGDINGAVTTVAINPTDKQEITAFVQNQGLVQSTDEGATWHKLDSYASGMAMHLAYDPQNTATMYLINQALEIHKTKDGGKSWQKVR